MTTRLNSNSVGASKLDRRIAVAPMMYWTDGVDFPRGIMCLDRRETPVSPLRRPGIQSAGHFAVDVITCYNCTMKVAVRRIGNSLGVLLPKATLDAWGVGEGDALHLTEHGLRPAGRGGFMHHELDELRRTMALEVVRRFTPREIRAQILANLHRWRRQGVWGAAYKEWQDIAEGLDDGELFAAMLGRDENAVRLRQSAPFVGLLPKEQVRKLNEEAAG